MADGDRYIMKDGELQRVEEPEWLSDWIEVWLCHDQPEGQLQGLPRLIYRYTIQWVEPVPDDAEEKGDRVLLGLDLGGGVTERIRVWGGLNSWAQRLRVLRVPAGSPFAPEPMRHHD